MDAPPDTVYPTSGRRLRRPLCAALAAATATMALLALAGWILGLPFLTRLQPDLPAMSPFCAIAVLGSSCAVWLLRLRVPQRTKAARLVACVVLAIGALRLAEYAAGFEDGFDTILPGALGAGELKHMAPNSAALFMLTAIAILLTDGRSRAAAAVREASILGVMIGAAFGLVGYLYSANGLYHIPAFAPMSLQTAVSSFLLAVGLGLARPHCGIAGVALSRRAGGRLLRRLLPVAVLVIVAFAWVCSVTERSHLLADGFADAILAAGTSIVLGTLIWLNALYLNRADQEQIDARRELQAAQAELERLLDHRADQLRASRQELRDTSALFEAVLQQMPSGVLVAEAPSGRIILSNDQARTLLRHPPHLAETIEGYTAYRGFHTDGHALRSHEWPLARSITTGEIVREQEIEYEFGDGERGTLMCNSAPVLDPGGRIIAAVVTFMDITAQKDAQREHLLRTELERELDSSRATKAALRESLGVVAHELRTPLACMRLTVETLLAMPKADAAMLRRQLESMETVAISMGETLDSLLDAARARAGRMQWTWTDVDVLSVCQDARATLDALARERNVTLRISVASDAGSIRGDSGALRRLLVNLVSNSCRHSSRGEVAVDIASLIDGGQRFLTVTVRDHGDGIAPDVLARLGDPFALGGGGISSGRGTSAGLGLSICRVIAAAHGGWIGVASRRGQGTIATARLAADLGAPVESASPPPPVRLLDWPAHARAA